jgi:hypothetical protein
LFYGAFVHPSTDLRARAFPRLPAAAYPAPVQSSDLSPKQAEALRVRVARQLRFLNRLCERMTRLGFPPAGELFTAALRARDAVQSLHVACHYASRKSGVGR